EVPYRGGILGVQDLVAEHIQYIFSDSLPAMQFSKAGRARALCVTGPERSPIMPELPPGAESVPGLVAVNWWGVFMPAGTPKAITDKFHQLTATSPRSEEHTSELQSPDHLVCRLLLEKKKATTIR